MADYQARERFYVESEVEVVEMSSSHESEPWMDRWWPLLVIIYGVLFVTFITQFHPTW